MICRLLSSLIYAILIIVLYFVIVGEIKFMDLNLWKLFVLLCLGVILDKVESSETN